MTYVCVCKYPLVITDRRDNQEIEYLAMPLEVIDGGILPIPDINAQETEGLDGITRKYIAVQWHKLTPDLHTKKYDVAGHVVIAGCEFSEASKGEDGHLKCDSKSIYVVLHPLEEWVQQHMIEIPPERKTS